MKRMIVNALWHVADLIGVEDESHWFAQFILWLDDDGDRPGPRSA